MGTMEILPTLCLMTLFIYSKERSSVFGIVKTCEIIMILTMQELHALMFWQGKYSSSLPTLYEETRRPLYLVCQQYSFRVWLCIKLFQGAFCKLAVTSKFARRMKNYYYYPASEMKTLEESRNNSIGETGTSYNRRNI